MASSPRRQLGGSIVLPLIDLARVGIWCFACLPKQVYWSRKRKGERNVKQNENQEQAKKLTNMVPSFVRLLARSFAKRSIVRLCDRSNKPKKRQWLRNQISWALSLAQRLAPMRRKEFLVRCAQDFYHRTHASIETVKQSRDFGLHARGSCSSVLLVAVVVFVFVART